MTAYICNTDERPIRLTSNKAHAGKPRRSLGKMNVNKSNQASIFVPEIDASLTYENYHSKKTNM